MRQVTFSEYLKQKRWLIDRLDGLGTFVLGAVGMALSFLGLRGRDGWAIGAGLLVSLGVYWLSRRLHCPRCQQSLPPRIARDNLSACPYCGLQPDDIVLVE